MYHLTHTMMISWSKCRPLNRSCAEVGSVIGQFSQDTEPFNIGLVTNLENDAKAMAYAEWKHGAGHNLPNVICVTLGTGIGGGLILNGRLYRGWTKVAGEIGQTSIDYQGKDFVYGKKGALEAYVGHVHISERAKENEPRKFTRRPVRPSLTRRPICRNSRPRRTPATPWQSNSGRTSA
jgi:hypothetical protein